MSIPTLRFTDGPSGSRAVQAPSRAGSAVAAACGDSSSPTPTPDVSVIIVSWNVRELLGDCLRSLRKNAGDVSYETIVVDNASHDGSPQMIAREFPWATLIEPHANLGFGRANNLGFHHARGRWILLLNPDTVVLDRAIETLVRFADNDPSSGAVGGRTLKADGSLERSCCWGSPGLWPLVCKSLGLHLLFNNSRLLNSEAMDWWPRDTVREVDVITGCCLMLRREVYEKTAGFDEAFFMYAEEVDLCWRIKKLGWRLMFCPDARIIHLVGASAAKAKPNRAYQINLGLLKLFDKHRGPTYMKWANALMWLFYATRLPILSAAAALGVLSEQQMAKTAAYQEAMARHAKLFRRQYHGEIASA